MPEKITDSSEKQERQVEVVVYSQESIPTTEVAKEISDIFTRNYPEMYSDTQRSADLPRYATAEQIQQQVREGNIYSVAVLHKKVVGFLKTRIENRNDIPDAEEWLGSWLLVDRPYRRLGIGEKLLEERFEFLEKRKTALGKRMLFIGDIHKENLPSRNLLAKLHCVEGAGKSEEYVAIRKEF